MVDVSCGAFKLQIYNLRMEQLPVITQGRRFYDRGTIPLKAHNRFKDVMKDVAGEKGNCNSIRCLFLIATRSPSM